MKKLILLLFLLFMLCLGCDSKRKKNTSGEFNGTLETKPVFEESSNMSKKKPVVEKTNSTPETNYTFEEFNTEFKDSIKLYDMSIGTWFWDEFGDLESQYGLKRDESKLLGEWVNVTLITGPYYNSYNFFPNKLFLLKFKFENFQVVDAEKVYFDKAVGTWEIAGDIVRITIYAVVTVDRTKEYPNNKGVFFVDRPYSFDFINIENIDERGFTEQPVNGNVLSAELERKVSIKEANKTNNLYVRNVYIISYISGVVKDYGYFRIVPEMARENISGHEIATDAGLIKRYIFGLWP